MQDWNYRHQTAEVENAGPSSYGKPKHLRDWKLHSRIPAVIKAMQAGFDPCIACQIYFLARRISIPRLSRPTSALVSTVMRCRWPRKVNRFGWTTCIRRCIAEPCHPWNLLNCAYSYKKTRLCHTWRSVRFLFPIIPVPHFPVLHFQPPPVWATDKLFPSFPRVISLRFNIIQRRE